jgi:hypothetical protein
VRVTVGVARLATALTISSLLAVQTASTQDAKPGLWTRQANCSIREERGCLEHSTRKSATANKTAIAVQMTTLFSSRSLFADSEAFNVESVVVT